jgi:predicted O-methyltransferase YrrM
MTWRILKYLQHQFYLKHRNGHGIHSPYLFEFVHEVVFNHSRKVVPDWVTVQHRRASRDKSSVSAGSFGAGSSMESKEAGTVGSFVRKSSVSRKHGALLYRIADWFKPELIVELGTGLGISTLYLGAGAPWVPVHTIEGNAERAHVAGALFAMAGLQNVKQHVGEIGLELDAILQGKQDRILTFMDGNHRFEPTVEYARKLISAAGEASIVVMDDIYWSVDMSRAWKEVSGWPESGVTIDLFQFGIILLRKDLHKTAVKVKF